MFLYYKFSTPFTKACGSVAYATKYSYNFYAKKAKLNCKVNLEYANCYVEFSSKKNTYFMNNEFCSLSSGNCSFKQALLAKTTTS